MRLRPAGPELTSAGQDVGLCFLPGARRPRWARVVGNAVSSLEAPGKMHRDPRRLLANGARTGQYGNGSRAPGAGSGPRLMAFCPAQLSCGHGAQKAQPLLSVQPWGPELCV
jgi:hypothetical protein